MLRRLYHAGGYTNGDGPNFHGVFGQTEGLSSQQGNSWHIDSPAPSHNSPNPSQNDTGITSQPVTKTLIAEPIQDISYSTTPDSVYIQDFISYNEGNFSYKSIGSSGSYVVYNFSGEADDYGVIKAYVDAITGGGYNLKLSVEHKQELSDTFYSWGLDYTGTGNINDRTGVTFTSEESTVMLYRTIERSRLSLAVWIPQNMEVVDLGLRYSGGDSGSRAPTGLSGASATAGLYLLQRRCIRDLRRPPEHLMGRSSGTP